MTPRLSVAIAHLPDSADRRALLADLMRSLSGWQRHVTDLTVVKDFGRQGAWPTCRKAWQIAGRGGSTHHLVLQEDVVVCRDFFPGLLEAIKVKPDVGIAPYANRKVMYEAARAGSSWATIPDGTWGQGYLLPNELVRDFLRWEARHITNENGWDRKYYDSRLAMWQVKTGRVAWAMCPSILDHTGAMRSTLGHNNKKRRARVHIGQRSALEIDWTKGADSPVAGPCALNSRYWDNYRE